MSLHRSLHIDEFKNKKRSVRKRAERIRSLILQKKWETGNTVFGLPKEKVVRMKLLKEEKVKPKTYIDLSLLIEKDKEKK